MNMKKILHLFFFVTYTPFIAKYISRFLNNETEFQERQNKLNLLSTASVDLNWKIKNHKLKAVSKAKRGEVLSMSVLWSSVFALCFRDHVIAAVDFHPS